jgi:hypothetical protein
MVAHGSSRQHTHRRTATAAWVGFAALLGTAACTAAPSTPAAAVDAARSAASTQTTAPAKVVTMPTTGASPAATGAATPGNSTSSQSADTRAGTPDCGNADLGVAMKFGGQDGHTMGALLVFTNVGGHTCTLRGYPGVAVVHDGKDLLDATRVLNATIDTGRHLTSPPLVTLAPNAKASAEMEYQMYDGQKCYSVTFGTLYATPPNTTETTVVDQYWNTGGLICSNLVVTPVVAGTPF